MSLLNREVAAVGFYPTLGHYVRFADILAMRNILSLSTQPLPVASSDGTRVVTHLLNNAFVTGIEYVTGTKVAGVLVLV